MYELFYNLNRKPFQLSPDPNFFYNSKGHKRALTYLRYGISQGDGFIVITGGVGMGKTTLVSTLLRSLKNKAFVTAHVVTTQLQADDLLRMVAAEFGVAYSRIGKASLIKNIQAYFRSCTEDGKRVLLVLDEAQNLPKRAIEELRMLSNFEFEGKPLLQSFLVGQTQFRETMTSPEFEQLRQRVIAAHHLDPLDGRETRSYIEHRLTTAGWQGDPKFSEEATYEIFKSTGGVPRRINTLCDRLLLYGSLERLHVIEQDNVKAVSKDLFAEQGERVQTKKPNADAVEQSGVNGNRDGLEDGVEKTGTAEEIRKQGDRLTSMENLLVELTQALRAGKFRVEDDNTKGDKND